MLGTLCAGQHGLEIALQVVVLSKPLSLTIWNKEGSFLCIVGDLNVLMMHTRRVQTIIPALGHTSNHNT